MEDSVNQVNTNSKDNPQERLINIIAPLISPLGYDVVHVEVHTHRMKVLRLFIDHVGNPDETPGIGVEDCVKVTKALDEPLDQLPEVEAIFKGSYELEVSSPGVDRPLRQEKDYERFSGREARIHVFRPLTVQEIENPAYQEKNPRQKNFIGVLKGVRDHKVILVPSIDTGGKPGKSRKKKSEDKTNSGDLVSIPISLISKANLEPKFDFDRADETDA